MKTGKTSTQGSYNQDDGEHIHFADWDSSVVSTDSKIGQVRFNTESKLNEVLTRRGWQPLLTQDQISPDPDKKLKDSIGESMQTAKKTGMIGIYCQGIYSGAGLNGIIDYASRPGPASFPSWMSMLSSPAECNVTFSKKLINEGTDVYLFRENGSLSNTGVPDFRAYIDLPVYLGIAPEDKYNWIYTGVGGLAGYNIKSPQRTSYALSTDIRVIPAWAPPSPDGTNDNDTSVNYGRFLVDLNFQWANSREYNANFNILVNAKKFKGF